MRVTYCHVEISIAYATTVFPYCATEFFISETFDHIPDLGIGPESIFTHPLQQ
jgi:hypothetical protein